MRVIRQMKPPAVIAVAVGSARRGQVLPDLGNVSECEVAKTAASMTESK